MIRASILLLLACAACGCDATFGAPEPIFMADARGAADVLLLPAASSAGVATRPLAAGVTYRVVVEGTVSLWRATSWSSPCAGTPAPGPNLPTPGPTGPVGIDAEFAWSWPAGATFCRQAGDVPRPLRTLRMVTSPGSGPQELPTPNEREMTPSHVYSYTITGTGMPAVFLVHDAPLEDNYGAFRILVFPAGPAGAYGSS